MTQPEIGGRRRSLFGVLALASATFVAGVVVAGKVLPYASGSAKSDSRTPREDAPGSNAATRGTTESKTGTPRENAPHDIAADRKRHQEAHEHAIAEHRTEPVDETWASATTSTLRKDFQRLAAEGHFKLADVDCRSATCLATVEWPNAGIAWQKWATILNASYAVPCGVEVFLDDPTSSDAPFRSVVVLACRPTSAPAGGAQP